MIYFHTKFHIYSSNDSLVIAIKLKAKRKFHAATMLLYTVYKDISLTKYAWS
jgi:hypothetical protein